MLLLLPSDPFITGMPACSCQREPLGGNTHLLCGSETHPKKVVFLYRANYFFLYVPALKTKKNIVRLEPLTVSIIVGSFASLPFSWFRQQKKAVAEISQTDLQSLCFSVALQYKTGDNGTIHFPCCKSPFIQRASMDFVISLSVATSDQEGLLSSQAAFPGRYKKSTFKIHYCGRGKCL